METSSLYNLYPSTRPWLVDAALQGILVIPLMLYTVHLVKFNVLLNSLVRINAVRLKAFGHLNYQFGNHHGGAE